jgi:hypothetical protein
MKEMKLIDAIRNLLGIRTVRKLPPAGPMPPIGSSIVFGNLRIKLRYPLDAELWKWFTARGWRTVNMRTNRRRYTCLPDKILMRLMRVNGAEREVLHQRIIDSFGNQATIIESTAFAASNHNVACPTPDVANIEQ